jgi:hypothetical protein
MNGRVKRAFFYYRTKHLRFTSRILVASPFLFSFPISFLISFPVFFLLVFFRLRECFQFFAFGSGAAGRTFTTKPILTYHQKNSSRHAFIILRCHSLGHLHARSCTSLPGVDKESTTSSQRRRFLRSQHGYSASWYVAPHSCKMKTQTNASIRQWSPSGFVRALPGPCCNRPWYAKLHLRLEQFYRRSEGHWRQSHAFQRYLPDSLAAKLGSFHPWMGIQDCSPKLVGPQQRRQPAHFWPPLLHQPDNSLLRFSDWPTPQLRNRWYDQIGSRTCAFNGSSW